jgi:putative thioredoxin
MALITDPTQSEGAAAAPAENGALIIDSDTERFATDVLDASAELPVIVDFWAPWCGPCKQLSPVLEKLVKEYAGAVRMVKINVDENQALAQQLRVQSIPMVYAFKDGRPVDAFTGALPESQLKQFIERLTGGGGSPVDHALEQAKAALDGGDAQTAGDIFSQILQSEPDNAVAAGGLARALMALGDHARAKEFIDGLPPELQNQADVAAARSALELAEASSDSGEVEELRAKVAHDPKDLQARFDLALALYGSHDAEGAIDELVEIVRRNREWNEQAARNQLIKIFDALGATDPVTIAGRRKLSSVLFS